MKSAEDWLAILPTALRVNPWNASIGLQQIRDIQSDAEQSGYERGLRDAAAIVDNSGIEDCRKTAIKMRDKILAILQKKKGEG